MTLKRNSTRIMVFLLLGTLLMGNVYAEEPDYITARKIVEHYELLAKGEFKHKDTVTRFECVSSCMRAAGLTIEYRILSLDAYLYNWGLGFEQVFFDDQELRFDGTMNCYLEFACLYGIALGEWVGCEERYFFPERAATIGDACTFMTRFLTSDRIETPEEAVQLAKEKYGLIREGDPFYEDSDALITPDYFCVMLERFLNQKMYKYIYGEVFTAEGSTGTYAEFLDGEYTPEGYEC